MRRSLSLIACSLGVLVVVACNSVLDIPEAHPKTSISSDTTPSANDNTNNTNAQSDCGPCDLPHAQSACKNGACVITACSGNFKDCNNSPDDGCEVDISSDRENCSGCGLACGGGLLCEESICRCHEDAECGDNGTCGTDPDDRGQCYCDGDLCAVGSACDGKKCAF